MREFDKNSLEKFFKSKLKHSINNLTTWNDPGDQIFNDAFESVQQKKKEKSRKFFAFAFLFGIIGIFSFGYFLHQAQLNSIEEELKELDYKIAVQEKDLNEASTLFKSALAFFTKSTKSSSSKTNDIERDQISQTISATPQRASVGSESLSSSDIYSVSNTAYSFNSQRNPLGFSTETSINLQPSTQATRFSNKTVTAYSAHIATKNREKFQFIHLSIGLSSLDVEGATISQSPTFAEGNRQNTLRRQGFSLTASTGANYALFNLKNSGLYQGVELTEFNNYNVGHQFNLDLSYALTDRFSLGMQASYNTFQNQSIYHQSTEFDQQKLSVIGNQLEYEMPIDIRTPIGAYSTNSVLELDATSPLFNSMDMDVLISQHIKTLGLALTSSYAFISSRKTQVGVSGKVGFYRIVDQLSTFDMTMSEDNGFTKQLAIESESLNGILKNNAFIGAGVFTSYALNKNISFNINSNYNRSLTSITNHENENQPRTFLNYFDSNVGISYNF